MNVLFVGNDLQHQVAVLATVEFTVERNRLNVLFVANNLQHQVAVFATVEFTVERNRLNVLFVANDLHGLNTLQITVELMFLLTLVQSCTHVVTVQSILHCIAN